MPGRATPLVSGEFYHLFNRGSDKRNIFLQPRDYTRFKQTFFYYQFPNPKPKFSNFAKFKLDGFKPLSTDKLVEIVCYCLMPNHFHFLVKQLQEGGIAKFMSQLSNSYTKYFNTKNNRVGALLQGAFKAVRVENDEQLMHVSRYIHLNPVVSGLVKTLDNYLWSSYPEFAFGNVTTCSPGEVLGLFRSREEYRRFVEDQIDYGRNLEIIKHQMLDGD